MRQSSCSFCLPLSKRMERHTMTSPAAWSLDTFRRTLSSDWPVAFAMSVSSCSPRLFRYFRISCKSVLLGQGAGTRRPSGETYGTEMGGRGRELSPHPRIVRIALLPGRVERRHVRLVELRAFAVALGQVGVREERPPERDQVRAPVLHPLLRALPVEAAGGDVGAFEVLAQLLLDLVGHLRRAHGAVVEDVDVGEADRRQLFHEGDVLGVDLGKGAGRVERAVGREPDAELLRADRLRDGARDLEREAVAVLDRAAPAVG